MIVSVKTSLITIITWRKKMHNCAQLASDQRHLILKYEIKGVNYIFENIRFLDNIGEQ